MPVTVRSGDTLGAIARANGTTVAELVAINPEITNPNLIVPGQEIRLPSETVVETTDEADRLIVTPEEQSGQNAGVLTDDVVAELTARFPLAATLIRLDPELAALVERAAQEDLAPDLIEQQLRASDWWRTRTETQRQFDIEEQTDPAEIAARIEQVRVGLEGQIGRLGLTGLADDELGRIAREAVRSGFSDQQVNELLLQPGRGTTGSGAIDVVIDGLGDVARSYLIDVAPDVLERRAFDIVAGTDTADGFRLWAENQAKSAYSNNPALVSAIEAGQTVEDFASQYRQLAARELELPDAAVDLSNPLYRDPILSEGLSLGEFRNRVRSDARYGWQETIAARDQAFALVSDLGRGFGLTA